MTKPQPIDGDPTKMRPPTGVVPWEAREVGSLRPLMVKNVLAKSWFEAREKYRRAGIDCDPVLASAIYAIDPAQPTQKEPACSTVESPSKKPRKAPPAPSSKSSRARASKKKSKSASSSARSRRRS